MNDNHFKFSASVIVLPFLFVLSLWTIFWADVTYRMNLAEWGIFPRSFEGLRGVVFSPFLHGNIEHLYNNSIPLLILLAALRYFYRAQFFKVVVYGVLFSGMITWIIGRDSYHIGASGLLYVLVSFIFFKGLRTKYYRLVSLSLVVIMIYGSMVWYVFPEVEKGISWEGHLGGLITGFAFAILLKTPEYEKLIKYDWEKPDFDPSGDKFLERFDADGNFVNLPKPEPEPEIFVTVPPGFTVIYNYQPKQKSENKEME